MTSNDTLSLALVAVATFFGISLPCLCRRRFSSRKWPREEDLSLLERESKRARLDVASASSNQVAPETLSRKLVTLNAQSLRWDSLVTALIYQ